MALSTIYKVYIQSPSLALTEVFPIIPNIEYEWEKTDLSRTLEKNVSSDLTFQKGDYTLLKTIEDLGTCENINLYIDAFCGGVWVRDFAGTISLRKCTWDRHKCQVKVKVQPNDVSRCVEDKSIEKVNILSVAFKPAVFSFQGFIETVTCPTQAFTLAPINSTNYVRNNSCINISEGWVIKKNLITNIVANGGFFDGNVATTWVRQRVNGGSMPPGSGWISIGGIDWVRPISTTKDFANSYGSYDTPLGGDINDERLISSMFGNGTATIYENGMYLKDILELLVNNASSTCNYTIISDFFSINRDFTNPTNIAYTNALASYNNMIVYKTADVKRPTALEKSTKMFISLDEIIDDLRNLFNIEVSTYKVGATNFFRIEHLSYYDNINGLDLTLQWQNVTQGEVYSYESDKLPKEERFYFSTQTDETGGIFDGYTIKYTNSCADSKTVIEHRVNNGYTNVAFLRDNDSYPDASLTYVACRDVAGQNFIISDLNLNDYMTWDKLQEYFHYYGRPFTSGTINNVAKTFVTPGIRLEEIEVINQTPCSINSIDVNRLIRSKLGWGKVKSASYDALNCTLSISLLH